MSEYTDDNQPPTPIYNEYLSGPYTSSKNKPKMKLPKIKVGEKMPLNVPQHSKKESAQRVPRSASNSNEIKKI